MTLWEFVGTPKQRELQRIGRAWMYFPPFMERESRVNFAEKLIEKRALLSDAAVEDRRKLGAENQGRFYFTADELVAVDSESINCRWRTIFVNCGTQNVGRVEKRGALQAKHFPDW